ncbi:MAG: signal peptidase I [Bacteroidia bacterium]|nr:signal peptidase I [Bacteroidia bacterium]
MNPLRKTIFLFFLLAAILLFIIGVAWLSIGILATTFFYWMSTSDNVIITRFKRTKWISYPFYFLALILFSIGIRIFLIEIFSIPSDSMKDTLVSGDIIVLNKLAYGPKMPGSPFEIPWVNIAFYLNKKYRTKIDSSLWKYKRLKGFSIIKHGEVFVFNSPKNSKEILIKRCMGLPGDTLLIRNEKVYANHKEIPEEGTIKHISRILFNNYALASTLFDSLGLEEYHNKSVLKNYFSTCLNNNQKQVLSTYKCIDSIIIERNRPDSAYKTFPKHNLFTWSIDNFGPLVIPAKGMKIQLNKKNFILYYKIINIFEMSNITTRDGIFFLNGAKITSFTFSNNYYFMLGDNRHDSNDSRYWGFVPEKFIIGKAAMVLFSYGEDGFRWNRIFKVIR